MNNILKALLRPRNGTLFGKAMSAGFWAVALRLVLRGSLIIRIVILARILTPEDFGLMAIAMISIGLLERFTQNGIESAIVQRKGDVERFLNTAWTLQIVGGLLTGAILALSAPWISQFFGAPDARLIIQVLSISIVMKGFVNIGIVLFIRDLRFEKLFRFEVAGRGAEIAVSIVAALILRNVWALVIGALAGALGSLIVSYVITDFRPRLRWAWGQFRQLFDFGIWVLASNSLSFVSANLDDILVGRILGVQPLGWYRMAYNFSQAVATEVAQVTSQVAFPAYSKLQSAAVRLRGAYLSTVHLVAFLGFPIAIGTFLVAEDLTYGVLGDQWAPIVIPMQILSVAGLIRGVSGTTTPLFQSQGRPDLPPRFILARIVILGALLYPAIDRFGLRGAAAVVVVAQALTGLPALALALSTVHARKREVIQAFWFPAVNTTLMATFVVAVELVFFEEPSVVSFVVLAGSGMLAYFGAVAFSTRMLGYGAPIDILERIRRAAA